MELLIRIEVLSFLIISFKASDITITVPCGGRFTEKQKVIYNAVLRANRRVIEAAKPGFVLLAALPYLLEIFLTTLSV